MPARTHQITLPARTIPTPCAILTTRQGQFPHIPTQHLARCTPSTSALVLQLPLSDWHTLKANTKLLGENVLTQIAERAHATGDSTPSSVRSFAGLPSDAVLILSARRAGSTETVLQRPGKCGVVYEGGSYRTAVDGAAVRRLADAMGVDLVEGVSDGPILCGGASRNALRKSVERNGKLARSVCGIDAIVPVQGGDDVGMRREAARLARQVVCGGHSIAGLYAGEEDWVRWECVRAVVEELDEERFRVLSGGDGAPWEVVEAVRAGVDCVEACFPFDAAVQGLGLDMEGGRLVNVRERGLMRDGGLLVDGCGCFVCADGFCLAYLRHLFEVHEMMAVTMVAAHNVWEYMRWFETVREAATGGEDKFETFANEFYERWERKRRGVDTAL